jgi:hypothetical protein
VMNRAVPVRAVICALLIGGLASPCAMAVDAPIRGQGEQDTETTHRTAGEDTSAHRPINSGQGSSGGKLGAHSGQQPVSSSHSASLPTLHSRSPLLTTGAVHSTTGVGAAARGYLLRRPAANHLAKQSDRAPGTAAAAAPITRAVGAMPSAGATRPPSAVYGATRQGAANLKLLAGNGVIGGPHIPSRGVVGGPANSRTVIKASIDGTAFHHR